MLTEELEAKLQRKFVLLDSGVLTRASDHIEFFLPLFESLSSINCQAVSFPLVEFEFERGAISKKLQDKKQNFLKGIQNTSLKIHESMIPDAIKIARVYASRNQQPSIVDCCIAAYLKQYPDLFLATLNHKDFPTYLFDRYPIIPIDTQKDLLSVAFYKYSAEKARQLDL